MSGELLIVVKGDYLHSARACESCRYRTLCEDPVSVSSSSLKYMNRLSF